MDEDAAKRVLQRLSRTETTWQEREELVRTLRLATEGLVSAGESDLVVETGEVPQQWLSRDVVDALVEIASNPDERGIVWSEAVEALAHIQIQTQQLAPADYERLAPAARKELARLLTDWS